MVMAKILGFGSLTVEAELPISPQIACINVCVCEALASSMRNLTQEESQCLLFLFLGNSFEIYEIITIDID
jgi:hypothetical protein